MQFVHSTVGYWSLFFFFFNDTPSTEIYTLSLHDALPILNGKLVNEGFDAKPAHGNMGLQSEGWKVDRKSTRLNSSHANISYAVFCLKKKKLNQTTLHDIEALRYYRPRINYRNANSG